MEEVTTAEIMTIIEDVLVEIYNSEYDEIKSRIDKLLSSKSA